MSTEATSERRVVPIEEAIERIGRGTYIHTFVNPGGMIVGADHGRDGLIADMRKHEVEESGETASAMGHTLVIVKYPFGPGRWTSLFIEAKRA